MKKIKVSEELTVIVDTSRAARWGEWSLSSTNVPMKVNESPVLFQAGCHPIVATIEGVLEGVPIQEDDLDDVIIEEEMQIVGNIAEVIEREYKNIGSGDAEQFYDVADKITKEVVEPTLQLFAEWFNTEQWRGGKGDKNKVMFVKGDWDGIVKLYLQKEVKESDSNTQQGIVHQGT
jgi:hypothetical protein